MSSSKIVITFNQQYLGGEFIEFDIQKPSNASSVTRRMNFISDLRTVPGEIPLFTGTVVDIGDITPILAAELYVYYYTIDYLTSEDTISRVDNVVTITVGGGNPLGCYLQIANFNTNALATSVITNCTLNTYELVSDVFQQTAIEAERCSFVDVVYNTSEITDRVVDSGVEILTDNVANPFTLKLSRGAIHELFLYNIDDVAIPVTKFFIPTYSAKSIKVNVTALLGSATVTFSVEIPEQVRFATSLIYEYSLDGVNFSSSNTVTGQTIGSYTVYVRDQFGCVRERNYEVTELGSREPYLYVSKANAITFKEIQEVDNCTVFRNEENSFDKDALNDITYCQEVLFNSCDKSTIQFKSNYANPVITLRKEDLVLGMVETNIVPLKRTTNLSRFESYDCWYYKYKNGLTGIYFTSGNTYDNIGLPNGTFTLNGNLPDFAIIGQFLNLGVLGTFEIKDVVYDSNNFQKAIIIDYAYEGIPTQSIATSVYDLLNFEIYEFEVDWSAQGLGLYDILIENSDPYQDSVFHLSENILILENHAKTLAIRYYNGNNRDIFYKYGIEHFIRVPFISVESSPLSETDINITDLTTQLTRSSVHELDNFVFDDLVLSQMRKIVIALSCEEVFINGIGYVKNGDISAEPIEGTNMYSVKAEMIKTNINYNNNRQGQVGSDIDIPFNIPPFVFGSGGFVKS